MYISLGAEQYQAVKVKELKKDEWDKLSEAERVALFRTYDEVVVYDYGTGYKEYMKSGGSYQIKTGSGDWWGSIVKTAGELLNTVGTSTAKGIEESLKKATGTQDSKPRIIVSENKFPLWIPVGGVLLVVGLTVAKKQGVI